MNGCKSDKYIGFPKSYYNRLFERIMIDTPYENTLTTNSTHQQLVHPRTPFSAGAVLSPSRVEEGNKAYDVKHEGAKLVEYQYKRAINPDIEKRKLTAGSKSDCFAFPFNSDQGKTLFHRNPYPGIAFYVLPLVTRESQLSDILKHVVFVDVYGIMTTIRRSGLT
jgi:hypothetical protein